MGRRACGFIIFRRFKGPIEYLLMQASYANHHWTPPKGHVGRGETDFQTALRETEEEAGFAQEDMKIFTDCKQEMEYLVKGKPKTVIYWLAELINKNKDARLSREHQDFKWLPIDEACILSEYSEMQEALKNCHKYVIENLDTSSGK